MITTRTTDMNRGFTLLEVILTISLVLGVTGVIMSGVLSGVDQSRRAEDQLLETVIVQTVFNQIQDASVQNPAFFGQLVAQYQFRETRPGVLESFGTVTTARPDVSTPFGPLAPSPLFTDLPTRAGATTHLLARLGFAQDRDALADFAVRLVVSNQETSQVFEGKTYYGGALGEMVRRVDAEVYRISELGRTPEWKPAHRMDRHFLVPVESLSNQASRELDTRHVPYDHRPFKEALRDRLARRPGFEGQDVRTLDLYALLCMIFTEVNQEHFKVEASSLLPITPPPTSTVGLRQRIDQLAPGRSGYLKLERGMLMEEKVLLTHDTFKRVVGPLNEMMLILEDLDQELTSLKEGATDLRIRSGTLSTAFAGIMSPTGFQFLLDSFAGMQTELGQHLRENARLVSSIRLIEHFIARPHMRAAFDRLRLYPTTFASDLQAATTLFQELSQDVEASPQVRATASRRWVAASVTLRMVRGEATLDPASRDHLALMLATSHGQFPLMADYVEQNPLPVPLTQLVHRNEGFTARLPVMQSLAAIDGPPVRVEERYTEKGKPTTYLDELGTTAGELYVAGINAIEGSRRLGLPPLIRQKKLRPVLDTLRPVLEESLVMGVTNARVLVSGAPVTRAARLEGSAGSTKPPEGGGDDDDDDEDSTRARPSPGSGTIGGATPPSDLPRPSPRPGMTPTGTPGSAPGSPGTGAPSDPIGSTPPSPPVIGTPYPQVDASAPPPPLSTPPPGPGTPPVGSLTGGP